MYRTLIPFNITICLKPYAYTLVIGLAKTHLIPGGNSRTSVTLLLYALCGLC